MRISDWSSDVCSSDLFQVLNLLAAGRSNKEIARLLCIAEGTVKVHIAAAFRMLGVHNRVSAVAMMQARAFDDSADETYLPGLLEERSGRPMLRRNFRDRKSTRLTSSH